MSNILDIRADRDIQSESSQPSFGQIMDLAGIGVAVKHARRGKGITQEALAHACGLSRATVNALEGGKAQDLGFSKVGTLLEFLGLKLALSPSRGHRRPVGVLRRLRKRYIWWDTPGHKPGEARIIAQVMDLGTYEDVKALEAEVGRKKMEKTLLHAEPGWFSPRSWVYWHVIRRLGDPLAIPPRPRRTDAFPDAIRGAAQRPKAGPGAS